MGSLLISSDLGPGSPLLRARCPPPTPPYWGYISLFDLSHSHATRHGPPSPPHPFPHVIGLSLLLYSLRLLDPRRISDSSFSHHTFCLYLFFMFPRLPGISATPHICPLLHLQFQPSILPRCNPVTPLSVFSHFFRRFSGHYFHSSEAVFCTGGFCAS